jgi:predicted RND superfamily exporter protein
MIGSLCLLMARGAIISMFCVILVLPAMFMLFDKVIAKTTIGFIPKEAK